MARAFIAVTLIALFGWGCGTGSPPPPSTPTLTIKSEGESDKEGDAPRWTATYQRVGVDVAVTLTLENRTPTPLKEVEVTTYEVGPSKAAGMPWKAGLIAPGKSVAKRMMLKGLKPGSYPVQIDLSYRHGAGGFGQQNGSRNAEVP